MKLLLDSCVFSGVTDELKAAGHEVEWVGDWPKDPGDREILERAYNEARILITLDKDFGELAVRQSLPHRGILRLVNCSSKEQASLCLKVIASHQKKLEQGAIITADPRRIRVRPR